MAFSQKLNMACEESFEIVPNKKAKSSVWNHFGFLKENDGPVDKTRVACKLCPVKTILKYSGNTTNLEDLSILLHLLIFLMNDSQTYKNSYEVSIVCKSQFVSKNVLQFFALTAVDSSS